MTISTTKTALPHYYTATEASKELGYKSTQYISQLCREGKVVAYKVGTVWLIPDKQVELLKNQEVTGKGARGQARK